MSKKATTCSFLIIILTSIGFASANQKNVEIIGDQISPITTEWSKTFGGTNDDTANSVIQTTDGGFVFVGITDSYGAGEADIWLVKTNANGEHEWNHTYGGTATDWSGTVIQTADGGYAIAGHSESFGAGAYDYWLVKTDVNGQHEWNYTYGGYADDIFRSAIQTTDGGFCLLGGSWSFSGGVQDWWLIKTDDSGEHQWNKTFGGPHDDRGLQMIQTTDGGLALLGGSQSYGPGGADFWLIKTDVNGQHEWNYTYGGYADDFGNCLTQTSDGGFALAGGTMSFGVINYDFWLIKTDSNGQHLWNDTYGGSGSEGHIYTVVQTTDEGYALAGETTSWGAGGEDLWLVKTDAEGQHEWNHTFGGIFDDWSRSLITIPDNGYILAGTTFSHGAGGADAWLIRLNSVVDTMTTTDETTSQQASPSWNIFLPILCMGAIL